jgi:N5-(cytidine 5'-diphosphoramidyl)-L-glutamine hydrolase
MKRLGISQRVEVIKKHKERRDCLDQRWSLFVDALGCYPLPLANVSSKMVPGYMDSLKLDGLLLSGGNSIACLCPSAEDAAPERDAFELALIREALDRAIPIIAVCRGMQILNMSMGGSLSSIEGHVGVRHRIISIASPHPLPEITNSYHNWSIAADDLAKELTPIAKDRDGNIEAFQNKEKKILGIMWHPEREHPINKLDIQLIESFLS